MDVVVTGGAGFIGSNLVRHLLRAPGIDGVRVIDDLSTGRFQNLVGMGADGYDISRFRFLKQSILDDDALDDVCAGAGAIVHLAALGSVPRSVAHPLQTMEVNATGTVRVLEAARRHGGLHVIAASSSSVYGANPTLPKHEDLATRPISPYAVSKLATESAVNAWGHAYGLPTLAFRFFNVFGPRQAHDHPYAAVIPLFTHAALTGQPVHVHGDGTQSRDFTFVDTVCGTIVDALQRQVTSPDPVNLAFGSRISLLDLIGQLEGLVGAPVERVHAANRAGDVPHSQADASRLRALFPDVQATPFAEGLAATVAWMRSLEVVP